MKKFWVLLKKEIKELLTPQLWVPFLTVIVVFFVIGNVTSKQMKEQESVKDKIVIADLDRSNLSASIISSLEPVATVVETDATDNVELNIKMQEENIQSGILIPKGFENNVYGGGQTTIESYSLMSNFSALAGKKMIIGTTSAALINEMVSNTLLGEKIGPGNTTKLKQPVTVKKFVSANGIIKEGDATQLLSFILGQTTTVPTVLFVVIVMAAQMIASAVATEKENKTLETLLSLPISRKAIVASKMLAAGFVSLIMASLYMLGIRNMNSGISGMASGVSSGENVSQLAADLGLKFSAFGYLELGLILFLAILLALSIAMILGAFAEDAKSAQGVVAPLMILVMIPYFLTLLMDLNSMSIGVRYIIYSIPFSHIFLAMPNILTGNHIFVLAGAGYMLILFVIFVLLAAKIFSSDLILTLKLNFSKKK
ncbi:MAG: ABC-2 family transporter protein [bacterium ADurb.Bin212]|nr:MAG: ABC-2 family transporter protein [bacterium ADurb.Bin212]